MTFNPNLPNPDVSPADQTVDLQNNFIHLFQNSIAGSSDVTMVDVDGKMYIAMKFPDDSWKALEPYLDGGVHKIRLVDLTSSPSVPYQMIIFDPITSSMNIEENLSKKVVLWDDTGGLTATIQLDSVEDLPRGFFVSFLSISTGSIFINPSSGVLLNGSSDAIELDSAFSRSELMKVGDDSWSLSYFDGSVIPATESKIDSVNLFAGNNEVQCNVKITKGILFAGRTYNLTNAAHASIDNSGVNSKIVLVVAPTSDREGIVIGY